MCTPTNQTPFQTHKKLMQQALTQARTAFDCDETPVGALLFDTKRQKIIATAHNKSQSGQNPLQHAEMLVIQKAITQNRAPYLEAHTLYVTLEPCCLCAAAMSMARVETLVFGAYNPKGGAVVHGPHLFENAALSFKPQVIGGVLEQEASKLLQAFFKQKRPNTVF
ncbi:MAG: nucleoside deaminase [Holosporaceae bacterium]